MQTEMTRAKLDELLEQFDTAMLVTRTPADLLRARPMSIAEVTDGALWFVTSRESGKVDEIEARSVVDVTLQASNVFVSLTAVARVVEDQARIAQLWKEPWRVWFPDGPKTPGLVLIRVEPTQAEFWDNRGAKGLTFLWEAVKAYAKGERIDDGDLRDDQHGMVDL
ncbi:MAG: pyridoxamine 5'-phosphate oxidase family protein [Myxococcota bacterium]